MNSQSGLAHSLSSLGKVIAFAAAIYLTPSFHDLTFHDAHAFYSQAYGMGNAYFARWIWGGICGFGIYFTVQALFSAIVTFVIVKLASH